MGPRLLGSSTGNWTRRRIALLRGFMVACCQCKGIKAVNVLADSRSPRAFEGRPPRSDRELQVRLRHLVFERLYEQFEAHLSATSGYGHVLVDDHQVGGIAVVARNMSANIPRQPLAPAPVLSHEAPGVQFADVVAYFMLQQVEANYYITTSGATDAIHDVAPICEDPGHPGLALIHSV